MRERFAWLKYGRARYLLASISTHGHAALFDIERWLRAPAREDAAAQLIPA
jgi:hypothetical protein